jgi:hypothetical protein
MNLPPINGSTFTAQTQPIFEIPTGRKNTFLDTSQSYLKFGIQVQTTAACAQGGSGVYIDNSAYSFVNQMTTYHGGNLLEFINEYGQLANYLLDNTLSKSQKAGLSSMILCNPQNNIF